MITSIVIISAIMVIAITIVIVWQCLNVINPQKDEWNQDYKPRLKLEIEKLKNEKRDEESIIEITTKMLKWNKKRTILQTLDTIISGTIRKNANIKLKQIKKELMIARLKLWFKIK